MISKAKKSVSKTRKSLPASGDQLVKIRAKPVVATATVDIPRGEGVGRKKMDEMQVEDRPDLTIWQRIRVARHPDRPYSMDYVGDIFSNFQELHGDRLFADDHSTICGTAMFGALPVMIIAQQKGRTTKEKIFHNFGSPNPEGYRKALRLMKLAARFKLPIITFIDTAGAYPGVGSEERHVAEAIAVNLREMAAMGTPIISVIIGEGGSGGALGIAVSDRVLIMENAYYSVISPEGCAAILWKDRAKAPEAAEALCLSSKNLLKFGIVEEVIEEPPEGAHNDRKAASQAVKAALEKHLRELLQIKSVDKLLSARYARFRKFGVFIENKGEKSEQIA
ncbi:MAG: acetyl-CoA carboxylase carboxyltransferase subunit alpha [Puniceicoccales bacterium]|jgi:acetyl-CoA carboxylase carboxyl transferase subunit alpha|nr:acetyl-CoA carboxylase carboxyltransferase subunit alpha [Puniceicoccales bacterium]